MLRGRRGSNPSDLPDKIGAIAQARKLRESREAWTTANRFKTVS
ncbi:hypothetical protein [Moorena sp. SIO3I8]|nr:hypothetical protein [Moorena sp. SIO3I8]